MATKKHAKKKTQPKSRKSAATTRPASSLSTPAAPTAPTEDDWERVIHQFSLFDDLENENLRRSARALPKLLTREADAIYRLVNQLLRTGKLGPDVDLSVYAASALHERLLRQGFLYGDPFGAWVHETLLADLSERLTKTESRLRAQADLLQETSEAVQKIMSLYDRSIDLIRTAPRGRYPSVAMYWLIRSTDQWGASISQIAKQLIKRDVESWSDNDDMDPMERWTAILKKGRTRARRRRANDEDDDDDNGDEA